MQSTALRTLLTILLGLVAAANTLAASASTQCPNWPQPVQEIESASIYGAAAELGAQVDAHSSAVREQLTKPVNDFVRDVARFSQEAVDLPSKVAADCALSGLRAWASAGALTSPPRTEAARKEIIWNTAGLTLAYMRIRNHASAQDSQVIELWLRRLTSWVLDQYGRPRRPDNVLAWVGLVATSYAVISGDARFWNEGIRIHEAMLQQIDRSGYMPLELSRVSRALAYHNFALVPLTVTDRLRDRAERPTSPEGTAALRRLEKFTREAMANPERIQELARSPQEEPGMRNFKCWSDARSSKVPPYRNDDQNRRLNENQSRSQFERWIGGACGYFAK